MPELNAALTHSHQQGTLLDICDLRPYPKIKDAVKAAGFQWSRNIGWYIPKSRDTTLTDSQLAHIVTNLANASIDITTTVDNTHRRIKDRLDDQAARSLEHAAKLDTTAATFETSARQPTSRASQLGSAIPSGQPTLEGHHSAPAHTRHIARIRQEMERAAEQARDAKHNAHAARRTAKRLGDPVFIINRLLEAERNHDHTTVNELLDLLRQRRVSFVDPSTIEPGQRWHVRNNWVQVIRVNKKTATVFAIYANGDPVFHKSITNRVDLRYFHELT